MHAPCTADAARGVAGTAPQPASATGACRAVRTVGLHLRARRLSSETETHMYQMQTEGAPRARTYRSTHHAQGLLHLAQRLAPSSKAPDSTIAIKALTRSTLSHAPPPPPLLMHRTYSGHRQGASPHSPDPQLPTSGVLRSTASNLRSAATPHNLRLCEQPPAAQSVLRRAAADGPRLLAPRLMTTSCRSASASGCWRRAAP